MPQQVTLAAYKPTAAQHTNTPTTQYLQQELNKISAAMANMVLLTPQVATKEPPVLNDGMIRLARSPWHPAAGQTSDAWVYWDAPSSTWKLL